MDRTNRLNRRTFLQQSGGAGTIAMTAPLIVSSQVWGANDTVNIGVVGPGRRGSQLMGDFSRCKGCQFTALADLNKPRAERMAQGKNWAVYQDFRKLLESKDVDAIVNATPDHWHALVAIYACMAGKDVYVEKPMTLTIAEGQAMVKAARKYDCVVQCGSQQRSDARSRLGCELVRNERLGKVKSVHTDAYQSPWDQFFPTQPVPGGLDWETWCGPSPFRGYHVDLYTPRAQPGWISIVDFSGGEAAGWGAHGLDMIQWALGMDESGPVEIWTEGNPRTLDRPVFMKYENGVTINFDGNGPPGGGKFVCENGTILADRGVCRTDPPELAKDNPEEGNKIKLPVSHHHQQNFIDCVKSREKPIADVAIGHRSTTLCHFVNIARWVHRKLKWDPAKETFIGDDDANTYLDRPRRKPWELPAI